MENNVLPLLLREYAPDDVYNADEFGLFFKLMPDKSFVFKNETCHGGKLSEERLRVLECTNSTSTHKLEKVGVLAVSIISLDTLFGKQKRKIILFVDSCPAHPRDIPTTNIKLVFLPPNTTSKLQPIDQGIIKVIKQKYRKKLVQRYLKDMESTNKISIKVMFWTPYIMLVPLEMTLNQISHLEEEDSQLLQNFVDYTTVDDELVTSRTQTLDEIIADTNLVENEKEDDDQEDQDFPVSSSTITVGLQHLSEIRKKN
ncbi:tigger transposable element-derived protein 4-like [Acyrthosiphon pisum]|uniref:DDE-1 domain-containing protein n=1 Tax=Acyrthosiphon pisum TaxID=7029 RepID=A0A8R1X1H1_ACYPI|nr:tigger transposable element-derived protein 4-like [Acyrthosiphon pisum]|eukprot:XP_008180069.1 PREDICTED: tigger transposable element-derived protein 4-like [Acyrthosiphon pisum]